MKIEFDVTLSLCSKGAKQQDGQVAMKYQVAVANI